jgi:hypothetical protein
VKRLILASAFIFAALAIFGAKPASAANAADFNPGHIISDAVFTNKSTMSPTDIQNFLNARVPNCDTNGTQLIYDSSYGDTVTRATYSSRRGVSTPFTCLRNYSENGLSAAQIIYNKAQEWSINPQTLIVLLQKEQALVTDDWPWPIQYRSATGYGCPDTSVCDSQYYGFTNQVHQAARMFRLIMNDQRTNYYPVGVNTILWHPNAACGTSQVNVVNRATSALYNYTPYRPNQAALNNLYGTGDSCSAYGNRNFWRYFTDWFGPTSGVDYAWEFVDISISTGSSFVRGNEPVTITVTARNTGNQSWSNSNYPLRLGTWAPTNHDSALYDPTWTHPHRPATLNEAVVLPGQNGTFTFKANVPNRDGVYDERFNLVAEGSTWLNDAGFTLHLVVTPSYYRWQMVSQSSSTGSFTMLPGATAQFTLTAKNTGNVTWTNSTNPVRLGTWTPTNRQSAFYDSSWILPVRPAVLQEPSVAPGANGTFVFTVKAPQTQGFYVERFNLAMEGVSWFEDPWMEFNVWVKRDASWQTVSTTSSTGGFSFTPGQTASITLVAKNTGNITWTNSTNPVRLGTWAPTNRSSAFYDSSWILPVRPALLQEASVAPGANGTFTFTVKAPNTPGTYVEGFNLAMDGVTWLADQGYQLTFNVGTYTWQMVSQSSSTGSFVLASGQTAQFTLVAKNTGNVTWTNTGNPVRLGSWAPTNRQSAFCDPSWATHTPNPSRPCIRPATLQEPSVAPGANGTFVFTVKAPQTQGFYVERFNLAMEGVSWFEDPWMEFNVWVQ